MTTQTIDLSGASSPESYSPNTLATAAAALAQGLVAHKPGSLVASCASLSSSSVWHPSASLDGTEIVGIRCDCPNGTRGGVRARCWHAAALERLIDEQLKGEGDE